MFGVFLGAFALSRLIALPQPLGVDEGIFATAGWGLTRGLMLYRDVWDQKPPGVHLAYAAGFALFGAADRTVLFLDILAATAACALTFAIASRLQSRRAAWAAAIAFTIGTYPAFALPYGGFLERSVPETFITPLVAFAAWSAASSRLALAGLAIGVAAIFKPTALIYWPILALVGPMVEGRGPTADARVEKIARAVAVSGAALLFPIAAVLLWLRSGHALADAAYAVIGYNRAYVVAGSSWLALPDRLAHEMWRLVKTDPLWCAAAFAGMAALWRLGLAIRDVRFRIRDSRIWDEGFAIPILSIAWLIGVVIAVAANGLRMYATYFLPAGPPLALLIGWMFDAPVLRRSSARGALYPAAAVLTAAIVAIHSHYPDRLLRYALADLAQLRGTAAANGSARRAAYLEMFGGYANGRGYSARANEELTAYLASHSREDERIYIFGMAPAVYFEARRLPADRFVWTFPGVAPFAASAGFTADTLAANLSRRAPRYLVLERNNRDSATGWRIDDVYASPAIGRLLEGYTREIDIEDFTVLRRR